MRTATLLAVLLLSACVPESGDQDAPTQDTAECGAADLQGLVGQPGADTDFSQHAETVRVIPPNSAVTMDHRPDRLNVDLDEDGLIVRIWCG